MHFKGLFHGFYGMLVYYSIIAKDAFQGVIPWLLWLLVYYSIIAKDSRHTGSVFGTTRSQNQPAKKYLKKEISF